MADPQLHTILSHYPGHLGDVPIERLGGAGGFSGARIWRLHAEDELLCLRRWPAEHPNPLGLETIHRILWHAYRAGIEFVPVPRVTFRGRSFVEAQGHLWELTRWMPGAANFRDAPSRPKLASALRALARFHLATESFPGNRVSASVPPGIRRRQRRLQTWFTGHAYRLERLVAANKGSELARRGQHILRRFGQLAPSVQALVDRWAHTWVRLTPCIRDVWHDHVLFTADRVTGIVDFGATGHECVSGDVARLLGSLVLDDPSGWHDGLQAYESQRPLSDQERGLVWVYDRANVVLSGLQWLEWIYVEGRTFEDDARVLRRLDEISARMDALVDNTPPAT